MGTLPNMNIWKVAGRPILSDKAAHARRPPRFPALSIITKLVANDAVTTAGMEALNTSAIIGLATLIKPNPPVEMQKNDVPKSQNCFAFMTSSKDTSGAAEIEEEDDDDAGDAGDAGDGDGAVLVMKPFATVGCGFFRVSAEAMIAVR